MELDHVVREHEILRAELARSEAERAQAESTCERLQQDRLQQQRLETALRAELSVALAGRHEAETTARLAVSQIASMKEIWTHTQARLDEERRVREILRIELAEARRRQERLAAMTWPIAWAVRPLRRARALIRRVRAMPRRASGSAESSGK